jgi:hypothetical protein
VKDNSDKAPEVLPFPGNESSELSQPHGKIPSWSRAKVYDTVTNIYLDCWDDTEVARTLSAQLSMEIPSHLVAAIRVEAAAAVENQPSEIRKKWAYRYRKVTVNNLVKEYMFIEGSRNFIEAKRALAKEIETLVKTTSPDQLCIAINDAVGRNNVGLETILQLEAYSHRAAMMDHFADSYAQAKFLSNQSAAIQEIAGTMTRSFNGECRRDYQKAVTVLKQLLGQKSHPFDPADVDYFLEYAKFSGEDSGTLMARLTKGADIVARPKSAVEQAIDGVAHHMSPDELRQLTETVRSSKLMGRVDLEQIMDYAIRQQKNVETMKKIGWKHKLPEALQEHEHKALEDVKNLVRRHLSLLDCKEFLSEREIAKAERRDISRSGLQVMLDQLNSQSTMKEVERLAEQLFAAKRYDFPLQRYLETRFQMPT